MSLPPSSGSVQDTAMLALPAVRVRPVGASGAVMAGVAVTVFEKPLVTWFVPDPDAANSSNMYCVALVSDVTVYSLVEWSEPAISMGSDLAGLLAEVGV